MGSKNLSNPKFYQGLYALVSSGAVGASPCPAYSGFCRSVMREVLSGEYGERLGYEHLQFLVWFEPFNGGSVGVYAIALSLRVGKTMLQADQMVTLGLLDKRKANSGHSYHITPLGFAVLAEYNACWANLYRLGLREIEKRKEREALKVARKVKTGLVTTRKAKI